MRANGKQCTTPTKARRTENCAPRSSRRRRSSREKARSAFFMRPPTIRFVIKQWPVPYRPAGELNAAIHLAALSSAPARLMNILACPSSDSGADGKPSKCRTLPRPSSCAAHGRDSPRHQKRFGILLAGVRRWPGSRALRERSSTRAAEFPFALFPRPVEWRGR